MRDINYPRRSQLTGKRPKTGAVLALQALAILTLSIGTARAAETLANPGFESGLGGWTTYSASSWNYGIVTTAHSGANAFGVESAWAGADSWSGALQRVVCAPGCAYSAGGWGYNWGNTPLGGACQGWLEVSFRNSADNILALYRSAPLVASTPVNTWIWLAVTNQYDPTTYAITNTVSSLVAPAGTVTVQYQIVQFQPNPAPPWYGGKTFWDDLTLNQTAGPVPPSISNLSPNGGALFNGGSTNLSFTVSSSTTDINPSGIHVTANGTDVSSLLTIGGTVRNHTVSLGLKTNLIYAISITVTDTASFYASASLNFDTFSPSYYSWEAEDYDYNSGQFIDNPQTNAYAGRAGSAGVDFFDITTVTSPHAYRTIDPVSTDVAAGDVPRQQYVAGGLTDYKVGYFDNGEWVNFTRTFPTGKYNIYARVDGGAGAAQVDLSRVTSGQGTPDQTTVLLGSFKFVGRGWSAFDWVPLTDTFGSLVAVNLGGVGTLRATTHSGADLNFFLLVPAVLDLPVVSNVSPESLLQPTNKFSFTASSPSATIPASGITLTLNGANVTSQLVIGGTAMNKSVSYTGLKTNQAYTAVITVTDANGNFVTRTVNFDTYNPSFTWEAEDWDYAGGQYVSAWTPCAYAGLNGIEGTDFHDVNNQGNHPYRSDAMSADIANDIARAAFAGTNDYALGYFAAPEWVNYTRSYPAGTYNVYGRFSAGGGTSYMSLSRVTGGVATSLGTFTIAGTGSWSTYGYVPLRDGFGNLVQLTIPSSSASTFRLTHTGGADANVNFLMLTTPRDDQPILSQVYPDGTLLLQATNVFRFTASNPTVPIYSTNITLTLNNVDVTSALTISGTPNSWNVSLPLALNVGRYTAAIRVQDANANVAATTVYFDTFQPTNFTWEGEDYDSTGGTFIDNPVPTSGAAANSYFGLDSTYGVDFYYETSDPATPYNNYMRMSLGIDVCGDYPPLAKYVTARLTDPNVKDYNLAYWTSNSWANYTHTYPVGTYNVYARMASGTGGSVQLDKLAGGVTNHLGQFNVSNWGWGVYSWWPLVDVNGQLVTVSLGGQTTLRATTDGSANANRFMLVTALAAVTRPPITVTAAAGNVVLSFPTQSGRVYQVWGKANLTDATWTLLSTLSGNDAVKTWSEPSTQVHKFYRLGVQ